MSLELPENIKEILIEAAEAARGAQRCLPILLTDVCASLDIPVERRSNVPEGKAFLAWDRKREKRPRILLPLERHVTWDRFCAAHELGHFVLISQYEWIPKGKKEYWRTEELCDFFARNLLVPEKPGEYNLEDVSQIIPACDRIARSAIIPWKQAADFVSENSSACILVIELDEEGERFIGGSTLPQRRGRMAPLTEGDLPMQIRNSYRRLAQGKKGTEGSLCTSDFMRGKLAALVRNNFRSDLHYRLELSGRLVIAGLRK